MDTDDLYKALSARVTADAIGRETDEWPVYFAGLRDLIRRVVAESTSDEERQSLGAPSARCAAKAIASSKH
jgi:hypothetical protein